MGTTNGLTLPSFLIVPQLRSLVSFLSQKQSLFTLPSVPKNSSTHPLSRVNSYLLASFFSVLNFIFGRPVFVSLRNQAQKYIPGIYGKVNTKKKKNTHPTSKMQFTVIAASLLASAGFAVATPPACLINGIGVQGSDATDMEMLCDAKQELVLGNLTASCADDMVEPAYEAYSSTCLAEASVTVASLPEQTDANATSSADASDVTGSSNSSSGSGNSSDSSSSSGGGSGNG